MELQQFLPELYKIANSLFVTAFKNSGVSKYLTLDEFVLETIDIYDKNKSKVGVSVKNNYMLWIDVFKKAWKNQLDYRSNVFGRSESYYVPFFGINKWYETFKINNIENTENIFNVLGGASISLLQNLEIQKPQEFEVLKTYHEKTFFENVSEKTSAVGSSIFDGIGDVANALKWTLILVVIGGGIILLAKGKELLK